MSITNVDWVEIQRKINSIPHGQKSGYKLWLCDRLDISKATLHRYLSRHTGRKKTIKRGYEFDPDNRLCGMIFDIKVRGERLHLQRRELATENCIKMLIDMGVPGAEQLYTVDEYGEIRYKISTVNRRLREMGYRERQPSKRIEADFANQVHMIDFSRSKYFQLWERDERTGDYMLKVSGNELHYKQSDTRLRTWVCQYLDDYSRLRKVRAYPETNESAFLGLEHLNYVYSQFEEHPLKYLPLEMFRSDNGAFRKSSETQTAMSALGVHMPAQMPKSKGGTAKVENGFRVLWKQFELPLATRLGDGARIWLSEYNELLEEYCLGEMNDQHPVFGYQTKGERYQASLADRSIEQKTTDADMLRLACRIDRRTVDAHLRVRVDNEFYNVPQYVNGIPTMGKVVAIHTNKYGERIGKLIDHTAVESFELEAWEPASWGEFTSFKKTPKTLREEQMDRDKPRLSEIIGGKADSDSGEESGRSGRTSPPAAAVPPSAKGTPLGEGRDSVAPIYMPPKVGKQDADSVFAERDGSTGRVFRTLLDAREFVGVRVQALGLNWKDVESYFDGLMDIPPVTEFELSQKLETIYEDYDTGRLAASNF